MDSRFFVRLLVYFRRLCCPHTDENNEAIIASLSDSSDGTMPSLSGWSSDESDDENDTELGQDEDDDENNTGLGQVSQVYIRREEQQRGSVHLHVLCILT